MLYGILGATSRINDDEAAGEMLRIYNEWLAQFCNTHPDRFAGLACIPNHDIDAAVGEIERVARRGGVRGLEISRRGDMTPLWDPWWNPMWDAVAASGLPVHFHTIGSGVRRDFTKLAPKVALAARASSITSFQMYMSDVLMSVIFAGVLEHHPGIKLVIGEAGTGWIPYILQRMDAEWEDQFKQLDLKMRPSEYWRRQCYATYQTRPDRRQTLGRARRGQHHVGLGLSAPRWGVARFAGIHRARTRPIARRDTQEDRLRQRRQALPLRQLSEAGEGRRHYCAAALAGVGRTSAASSSSMVRPLVSMPTNRKAKTASRYQTAK